MSILIRSKNVRYMRNPFLIQELIFLIFLCNKSYTRLPGFYWIKETFSQVMIIEDLLNEHSFLSEKKYKE